MSESVDAEVVTIDKREPDKMLPLFEDREDVEFVTWEQMEVGDYVVRFEDEDPVVFERKTISDFIGSMKNRRLESQVNSMYEEFSPERTFLVIEGDLQDFDFMPHSEFSAKSAQGFVASLSGRWQCVPLFCSDKVHLADMVVRVSRKCVEETDRILRDPDSTPTAKKASFYDKMLLQLEGIGKETKDNIQEHYPSVQSFVKDANSQGLQEVDGIGPKTAESILSQVE